MDLMVQINIIPENCRGCRSCETACAWWDKPPFNPRRAGIHIIKDEEAGSEYPLLNMECREKFCGKQAPGARSLLEPACVTACLFDALQVEQEEVLDAQ